MAKKRSRVLVNFAITVDGKISAGEGEPSGFTSSHDKRRLSEIRSLGDAVMVGRKTVATDEMAMGISAPDLREKRVAAGKSAAPLRVIVSAGGKVDPRWKVFANTETPLVICTITKIPDAILSKLPACVQILEFEANEKGEIPMRKVLEILRDCYGVKSLVCEGGATLLKSLLANDLVDEIYLTIAPLIFGGANAMSLSGLPEGFLPEERKFRLKSLEPCNGEAFLHYLRDRRKK